jgi:hypothetical protein
MIGDDIRSDIAGAQAAGLKTLLVRTGKFRPADLETEIRPDGVIDSIADLPAWWQRTDPAMARLERRDPRRPPTPRSVGVPSARDGITAMPHVGLMSQ